MSSPQQESQPPTPSKDQDPFPWHLGVHDAHCHPLEHPRTFANVPTMKTRTLAVMATRSQDQPILDDISQEYGPETVLTDDTKIVPGFGWHPWFSHLLYDDSTDPLPPGTESIDDEDTRIAHYARVLTPSPDRSFSLGLERPRPLSLAMTQLRTHLTTHPLAIVGEIGIDKAFRLPLPWQSAKDEDAYMFANPGRTPGGRCRRGLSGHRVDMAHQKMVLDAQLRIAGEFGRGVSVHGVQAHGVLYEVFRGLWKGHERVGRRKAGKAMKEKEKEKSEAEQVGEKIDEKKPFPPRVCLHSYSGSLDSLKPYFASTVPSEIYITVSWLNNFQSSETAAARTEEVVRWIPETSLLVESDLHKVGDEADELMEKVTRRVCEIRGWPLEEGVGKIGRNFWRFVTGVERDTLDKSKGTE